MFAKKALIAVTVLALATGLYFGVIFKGAEKMPNLPLSAAVVSIPVDVCTDGRVVGIALHNVDEDPDPEFIALYASDNLDVPYFVVTLDEETGKATTVRLDLNRDGVVDKTVSVNDPSLQASGCEVIGAHSQDGSI